MATTAMPISFANPSIPLTNLPFHSHSNLRTLRLPSPRLTSSARSPSTAVKCSSPVGTDGSSDNTSSEQIEDGGGLKNALSGMVDERVGELLNREENRDLLDGLDKAARRVESARRGLAEIEKQQVEARKMKEYINQLETRASEIAEAQKKLSKARAMAEDTQQALQADGAMVMTEAEREAMHKNKERLESFKAALISAIVGTLAGLPISLIRATDASELMAPTAITAVSCALYGATFRYAVRRDLDDFHLKTGTAAAFGVIKGLATLGGGPSWELEAGGLWSYALNGAVYVCENLLVFLFGAVGLDFCFKLGILSPFPTER